MCRTFSGARASAGSATLTTRRRRGAGAGAAVWVPAGPGGPGLAGEGRRPAGVAGGGPRRRDGVRTGRGLRGHQLVDEGVVRHVVVIDEHDPVAVGLRDVFDDV